MTSTNPPRYQWGDFIGHPDRSAPQGMHPADRWPDQYVRDLEGNAVSIHADRITFTAHRQRLLTAFMEHMSSAPMDTANPKAALEDHAAQFLNNLKGQNTNA